MPDRLYEDYFDLQLRVATGFARLGQVPIGVAIDRFTNLRRRLGLVGPSGTAAWQRLLQCASEEVDHHDLLDLVLVFHARRPHSPPSPFGCFSCDAPDADGSLRIHFMPDERHRSDRPLGEARLPERRAELRALIANVRQRHPTARHVEGRSWLYNAASYTRLFPAKYVASIHRPEAAVNLTGSSTWGQVLDYQGRVKPSVRDHLLANLNEATLFTPWRAFPLAALVARADIDCFDL